ncbi:MAG: uroporphyrinogen decarboxylase family protein [Christensenellaceae bacterium]
MNSRQRGLAPFLKQSMDRFPMWYGAAPQVTENIKEILDVKTEEEALYEIIGLDYKTIRPQYIGPVLEQFTDGTHMSEWGIKRGGVHYGQALTHPLEKMETVKQIETYKGFPNPDNYEVRFTKEQLRWAKDYCLIGGCWSPFFHDSTELMDMEEFFINMYTNPDVCYAIIEKCFEFYYELDRRTFEANPNTIDMYFIGNDFGSQRALLMAPDMWRKFYKQYVAKLIAQAKKNGCVTAVHSCGDIHEIIGDFIEIGVDAINPIQVNAQNMNPEVLIKEFGDDCVFFGGIDENEILQNQTPQQVRDETRRIIDILGSKGRYIVAASHDYILPEIPAQNIIAMFDEAKKYGCGK